MTTWLNLNLGTLGTTPKVLYLNFVLYMSVCIYIYIILAIKPVAIRFQLLYMARYFVTCYNIVKYASKPNTIKIFFFFGRMYNFD